MKGLIPWQSCLHDDIEVYSEFWKKVEDYPYFIPEHYAYSARCKNCFTKISGYDTEEEAIEAWNKYKGRQKYDKCF